MWYKNCQLHMMKTKCLLMHPQFSSVLKYRDQVADSNDRLLVPDHQDAMTLFDEFDELSEFDVGKLRHVPITQLSFLRPSLFLCGHLCYLLFLS